MVLAVPVLLTSLAAVKAVYNRNTCFYQCRLVQLCRPGHSEACQASPVGPINTVCMLSLSLTAERERERVSELANGGWCSRNAQPWCLISTQWACMSVLL